MSRTLYLGILLPRKHGQVHIFSMCLEFSYLKPAGNGEAPDAGPDILEPDWRVRFFAESHSCDNQQFLPRKVQAAFLVLAQTQEIVDNIVKKFLSRTDGLEIRVNICKAKYSIITFK